MDDKQIKLFEYLNSYIDKLLEEGPDEEAVANDIIDLNRRLERIRQRLYGGGSFPYSYCEIEFRGETEVDLPEYGVEVFNRKLKDRMYFTILGGSEDDGYMFIKTKSFPDNFKMKLTFNKLKLFKKQSGEVNLIYDNRYYGPEETVYYELKELK